MKQFKKLMFVATVAMAFAGCSKDSTEPVQEIPQATMIVTASNKTVALDNETRTYYDNGTIKWAATGEALQVVQIKDGKNAFSTTNNYALIDGKATFTVSFPALTEVGNYLYAAVYPQTSYANSTDMTSVIVGLPNVQQPTATSYDPAADLMISSPVTLEAQPAALDFAFGRIAAFGKMSISNLAITAGEFVKEVTFTAANKLVTGRGKVDLTQGKVLADQWGYTSVYKFNNVVMRYTDNTVTTAAFDAWFSCVPFALTTGDAFTVEVLTDKGTYTREITLGADKNLAFTMGNLASFGVDMATATFVKSEVDASIFNISFGLATSETSYSETYDMGNTGTTGNTLTYSFKDPNKVIRVTGGNQLGGYEGASKGAYYWATTASSPFQIGNVAINNAKHFTLSFGAGIAITTLQAYISVDGGTKFFPLSQSGITTTTGKEGASILKTMNFSLVDGADHANCIIRLANEGSATCVVDDVRLVALAAAAEGAYQVDFLSLPELITTPADGGTLAFAANSGTAGAAPATQQIDYMWEGGNCTFAAVKADGNDWYTISDNNNASGGVITVTPTEYTATDADRTGTVTLTLTKNGEVVKESTITISQTKVGGVVLETYDETFVTPAKPATAYGAGTITSVIGTTWNYTDSRTDQKIGGKTVVTFKAAASPKLTATVAGKVQNISFTVGMPFSDTSVSVDLYINDVKIDSYTASNAAGTGYKDIDVSAQTTSSETTKIEFRNGNAKRAAVGNISYQK